MMMMIPLVLGLLTSNGGVADVFLGRMHGYEPTAIRGSQPCMAAKKTDTPLAASQLAASTREAALEATIDRLSCHLEAANMQAAAARREAEGARHSTPSDTRAAHLAEALSAKYETELVKQRDALEADHAAAASLADDKIAKLERDLDDSRATFEAELLVQRAAWEAMEAALSEAHNKIEELELELQEARLRLKDVGARGAAVAKEGGGREQPETLAPSAEPSVRFSPRATFKIDPSGGVREAGRSALASCVVGWVLAASLVSGIFFDASQVDFSRIIFPPVVITQFSGAVPLVSQRLSELLAALANAPHSLIFPPL